MNEVTLMTTYDNPWDPFEEWDQWYNWDMLYGHNTCGKVASLCILGDALGEEWEDWDLERAKNILIELFGGGIYRKVTPGQIQKERAAQSVG